MGMMPLGGTESPSSTSVHTLTLSGAVANPGKPVKALARCRMTFASGQGVTMELSVRADSDEACQLIMSAIA